MRVIAGALGGRSLVAPSGLATRPTSDRVREALFSVLGDLSGAVVLDLYAGTGALGIEALSRGAARAVFVENGRQALAALRQNIAALGLGNVTDVITKPVRRAVSGLSLQNPFDLVFVDPPYADLADASSSIELVAARGLCANDAQIVLEHASRDAAPALRGLTCLETRRYGDTSLSLYAVRAATTEDPPQETPSSETSPREDVS